MSEWSDAQRRMVALGYYSGRIDNDPGGADSGTLKGTLKLLDLVEKAQGIVPAPVIPVAPAIAGNYPLPASFDPNYRWIGKIGTLPRILQEFIDIYGVKETIGTANNPEIMGWAKETGLEKTYTADSIAWCGLGMAVVAKRAGYTVPAGPLWALNWLNFGVKADVPSLGDVLCFVRDGGGHVGEYVGEDESYYHVLGANTSDMVKIARIAKSRLKGARRPAYKNPLPTWKPYHVTTGGAVSTNEA
jgi:uncharacterized protein (TIGR02594 family)